MLSAVLFLEVVDMAFYFSAARSLIAESVKKAGLEYLLGRTFSILAMFSMASAAAGSVVSGFILDVLGFSETFTILLVLTLIALVLRFFHEETLGTPGGSVVFKNPLAVLRQFSKLRNVKYLPHIIAYVVIISLISSIANVYIPIFMESILAMSMFLIGLSSALEFAVTAVLQPFAGKFIDKHGPVIGLAMMSIIAAPAIIAFAHAPNPWLAILFITISSSASAFYYAGYPVLITKVTTEDVKSTTYGTLDAIMKLAAIPGPTIAAILWALDPRLVFYTIAILEIAAIATLAILDGKLDSHGQNFNQSQDKIHVLRKNVTSNNVNATEKTWTQCA